MRDPDETPFDRYDTSVDGDEETRRMNAALDWVEARLAATGARLDAFEVRLARLDRRIFWWGLVLTLEVLVGFGLVAWWRAP
jgi:hypothetical protein